VPCEAIERTAPPRIAVRTWYGDVRKLPSVWKTVSLPPAAAVRRMAPT